MKYLPLKGKIYQMIDSVGGKEHNVCICKDVESAVHWLDNKYNQIDNHHKEFWDDELKKYHNEFLKSFVESENNPFFKRWLLKKAFSDVVEK